MKNMETKLSDFSEKELALLQLAVDDKVKTCTNNLEILSKFEDSEFKEKQSAFWFENLDTYQLWTTQIMNAIVEVRKRTLATLN